MPCGKQFAADDRRMTRIAATRHLAAQRANRRAARRYSSAGELSPPSEPTGCTPTTNASSDLGDEPYESIVDAEPERAGAGARAAGHRRRRRKTTKPIKMDWYILKVQSNREDSIREGLQRRVEMAGLDRYFGESHRADRNGHRVQRRQEEGRQAEAVSGLPRRAHGDQRRHLVPGPRDAGHRRFHRLGRQAHRRCCRTKSPRSSSKTEEKTDEAPKLKIAFNEGRPRQDQGRHLRELRRRSRQRSTKPAAA